jgi:hypothetical protein
VTRFLIRAILDEPAATPATVFTLPLLELATVPGGSRKNLRIRRACKEGNPQEAIDEDQSKDELLAHGGPPLTGIGEIGRRG